jgi:hypothetical protein
VPFLHRLIEPEIGLGEILEVLLHLLEFRSPVLCVDELITPGAEPGVVEHQRDDPAQEVVFFLKGSLVDEKQLGRNVRPASGETSPLSRLHPKRSSDWSELRRFNSGGSRGNVSSSV